MSLQTDINGIPALTLRVALIAGMLVSSRDAGAQQPPASGDVTSQRAERVKSLLNEIIIQRTGDFERITSEYAESHISEIRSIVQEHVLEALNRSDKPDDVRHALKAVLGAIEPSFAFSADLKGVKTAVAAFSLNYGGALTDMRGILLGYRKTELGYEVAADESMRDCTLVLEDLYSPRANEMWLLADARVRYFLTGAPKKVVLYSFDGYKFKELWTGGGMYGEVKIGKSEFTVDYMVPGQPGVNPAFGEGNRTFRDTVKLTSGGPVASKQELSQK